MPDTEFEAYLALLSRFLRLSPAQREDLRRELRAHLDDALETEMARGLTRHQAVLRILDDFGDAAELAHRFGRPHPARRWIMQGTLTAACLAIIALGVSLLLPSGAAPTLAQQQPAPRTSTGADPVAVAESMDAVLDAALNKRVPEVNFTEVPLDQLMAWLSEASGANMVVLWSALEQAGVQRDRVVPSLKFNNVSVKTALQIVLADMSDGPEMTYDYFNNVIVIGPTERFRPVVRAYDVRDLLQGDEQGSQPDAQQLIELVMEAAAPDSWASNGGVATVRLFRGTLVVRNYGWAQREVRDLISQLREAQQATR